MSTSQGDGDGCGDGDGGSRGILQGQGPYPNAPRDNTFRKGYALPLMKKTDEKIYIYIYVYIYT